MLEKIIANTLDIEEGAVKDEANFIDDLGADSLNIVELVMEVEQEFDIEIPDEDAEGLNTVGDLRKYIEDYS